MAVKKNVFTYICYILFILCTLLITAVCVYSFCDINAVYLSCSLGFIILLPFFLYILSIIFHNKNKNDKLDVYNCSHSIGASVFECFFVIIILCLYGFSLYYSKYEPLTYPSRYDIIGYCMAALLFIFIYLTARVISGRLAALFSLVLCVFTPDYYDYIFNGRYTLFSALCIWFVILWFTLFFNMYKKKSGKLKLGYISIFLCGLISNLLVFTSDYSVPLIIIIILYMLFKHWKPAFLYMFAVFPALFFTGISLTKLSYRDICIDILASTINADSIKFNDAYIYSDYFYMIMLILSLAGVITLFVQNRKSIQILMCFVSITVFCSLLSCINTDIMLYVITVTTLVSAHFVQSLYSYFVRVRCKKYYKEPDISADTAYDCDTEPEELPIPVPIYDKENPVSCTIITKECYQLISKETLDAFERRKQRAIQKAAEKYNL